MKLVFHVLLALVLVGLMRKTDDALVLALAGCVWMGVAIAASLGPSPIFSRNLALDAQAVPLAQAAGRLLLGLVTAFLVYGLAEQIVTLPGKLRALATDGGSPRAAAVAIVSWAIGSVWLLMAVAPVLVRARRAGKATAGEATAVIRPGARGLVGACLAAAPVALCWAKYGGAWAQGFLTLGDLIGDLPGLAPLAVPVVAGAELWRRSLAAGPDPGDTWGLLRIVMRGAAVAYLAQAVGMTVAVVRIWTLPEVGARGAAVGVGGVFLIAQALAWTVATWRLSRLPGASLPRALLACVVLFLAMLLTAIPPGAVLTAAEWAPVMAVAMLLPWLGSLALSQTLVVWLATRIMGDADGPSPPVQTA